MGDEGGDIKTVDEKITRRYDRGLDRGVHLILLLIWGLLLKTRLRLIK